MRKYFFIALALTAILFSPSQAQGIDDALNLFSGSYLSNARTLGMGNAFLSVSDDANAMYFNPAGLGLVKQLEFTGGIDYERISNSTTFFNETNSYNNSKSGLNQFAFVLPFPTYKGSFSVGFSYNRSQNYIHAMQFSGLNPGISKTKYLIDPPYPSGLPYYMHLAGYDTVSKVYFTNITDSLYQNGLSTNDGKLENWKLSASLEIAPNLFAGISLGVVSGKYTNEWSFTETDTKKLYANILADTSDIASLGFRYFTTQNTKTLDISGFDMDLGLLYQMGDFGRFAIKIAFPKTVTVKDEILSDYYSSFANYDVEYHPEIDKIEYDITSPMVLSVGGSINLMGLILSADVTMEDYSEMKFSSENISFAEENQAIKTNMRATVNPNFGAEYTFADMGLRLRAGYFYEQSPYKNDPTSYNRKYYTYGAGFLVEDNISIDAAFVMGSWKTIGDNYGYELSRTYQDVTMTKLVLSFSYRF